MTALRPFPWQTLEPYRRADLEAWRHLKRWAALSLHLEEGLRALEALVGTRVEVRLKEARRRPQSTPLAEAIWLEIEPNGTTDPGVRLEVEAALASTLVARVLKRPPPRIHAPIGREEGASLAGSFAALVSAVGRRTHGLPLRVKTTGLGTQDRASGSTSFDTGTFTVLVEDEAYLARVSLPGSEERTGEPEWNRDRLRRLGETPIGVPIVAQTFSATPGEVGALLKGDAWMLGRAPILRSLRGKICLAAPDAAFGVRAELVDDGSLVLRGGSEELGWSPMVGTEEEDALVQAVGDVPILVRVEVGTVRMTAREWAGLVPGDVVEIARRIGDPVTLRVSGVEVARGELVDIEGEIGVRVLSRLGVEHAR